MSNQVNLDELKPLTTNYQRGSQNYDLRYLAGSGENGYFEVSEDIHTEWNMEENGFTMFVDPVNKTAYLAVLSIDQAVSYRGSSRKFTSSKMINKLLEYGIITEDEDENLFLNYVGDREEIPYYQISGQPETSEETPVVEGSVEEDTEDSIPSDTDDEELTEQLNDHLSV